MELLLWPVDITKFPSKICDLSSITYQNGIRIASLGYSGTKIPVDLASYLILFRVKIMAMLLSTLSLFVLTEVFRAYIKNMKTFYIFTQTERMNSNVSDQAQDAILYFICALFSVGNASVGKLGSKISLIVLVSLYLFRQISNGMISMNLVRDKEMFQVDELESFLDPQAADIRPLIVSMDGQFMEYLNDRRNPLSVALKAHFDSFGTDKVFISYNELAQSLFRKLAENDRQFYAIIASDNVVTNLMLRMCSEPLYTSIKTKFGDFYLHKSPMPIFTVPYAYCYNISSPGKAVRLKKT